MKKNTLILFMLLYLYCVQVDGNTTINQQYTTTKLDAELQIAVTTLLKILNCGLPIDQAFFLSSIGNDEDPNPEDRNKSITYEKKAVDRCIKSILFLQCPTFPLNTTQSIDEMTTNIVSNRILNCTFEPVWFFKFNKPFSGAFF